MIVLREAELMGESPFSWGLPDSGSQVWLSWNYKAAIKVLAKAVVSSAGLIMEGSTFIVINVFAGRTKFLAAVGLRALVPCWH